MDLLETDLENVLQVLDNCVMDMFAFQDPAVSGIANNKHKNMTNLILF